MTPKVSVIVPVYNVEAFLPRCLDSIVGQSLRDIETICVDDQSPDRSIDILNRYAAADGRVCVISQENKHQGGARNTGLDIAQGEYVAFIDSDDWIDEYYIEKLYDAACRHDADIVCASVIKERKAHSRWQIRYESEQVFDDTIEKFDASNCPPVFNTTNKLFRRSALLRSGLRFKEHAVYEDVEYLASALYSLGRLATVPGPVYHYIVHGGSTTKSRQTLQKQADRYNAHKAFVAFADAHGVPVTKRFRDVTIRDYVWAGISWLKVKDNGCRLSYRLLDLIPICYKKLD